MPPFLVPITEVTDVTDFDPSAALARYRVPSSGAGTAAPGARGQQGPDTHMHYTNIWRAAHLARSRPMVHQVTTFKPTKKIRRHAVGSLWARNSGPPVSVESEADYSEFNRDLRRRLCPRRLQRGETRSPARAAQFVVEACKKEREPRARPSGFGPDSLSGPRRSRAWRATNVRTRVPRSPKRLAACCLWRVRWLCWPPTDVSPAPRGPTTPRRGARACRYVLGQPREEGD